MLHIVLSGLARESFQVELVCSTFPDCKRHEIIDGIRVNRFSSPLTLWLYAIIRHFALSSGVDMVVDSIGTGSPLWLSPIFARSPKLLVIYHIGGRKWYALKMLGYIRLHDLPMSILTALAYAAEKLLPFIYRRVPVLTFSRSTANELVGLGFDRSLVNVVQEGIDLSKYCHSEGKAARPGLVCLGRLSAGKGIEFVLRSMVSILKELPDTMLYVLGRGELEPYLKSLSRSLKIDDSVRFLGYVSENEKINTLQRCQVLVVPSLKEGFATPVIEANACGTVAVGWDVQGVNEAINDGVNGYVARYGDINKLSDAIVSLLHNEQVRKNMEERARLWARKYDKVSMVEKSVRLISRLLSSAGQT